jgi:hypothetical protein
MEWGVQLAVGVELAASRHIRAEKALRVLAVAIPPRDAPSWVDPGGQVLLEQGDILSTDLTAATVVWCAALLFSEDFMRRLAAKLASCPRLRSQPQPYRSRTPS